MPKKSTVSKLEKIASQPEVNNQVAVNPNRQAEIIAECDKAGLTLAHLVKTVFEATVANKVTIDKDGYEHIEPDTQARLKATSLGFDLRGETNSKVNVGTQNNIINVIDTLNVEARRRLDEYKRSDAG